MPAAISLAAGPLIPDVLVPGLNVVFCGTALGNESFRRRAYYAHPGNRFWRTLHEVGLTPRRLAPADYAQVTRYGIGLTDMCKTAYGNDCDLSAVHFDAAGARMRIVEAAPRYLAFTSKKAASVFLARPTGLLGYGLQEETCGAARLFILPSPSGAGGSYWDIAPWRELAERVRGGAKKSAAS